MNSLRLAFAAAAMTAAIFVTACAGAHTPSDGVRDWSSLTMTLTRSVCFGACPDYQVTIRGDGSVVFEGHRFVAQPGRHEARISQDAVHALFAKFVTANFFSLADRYHAQVTDLPTYTLTLAYDGRTKTVSDYGGRMMGMPEAVTDLENAIDLAALTQRWIKGPAGQ